MAFLADDLAFRGLVHQASDPELLARLDRDRLCVYAGFDPSADSLHIGNLLIICNLRRLQEGGHRPIALRPGGTGLIGDPGGKTDERPLKSREEQAANLLGISAQLERFLDFSAGAGESRGLLLNNADWLCDYPLIDFLRDIGKFFTVNQMIQKESVRSRLERPDQGISYTEFSYMLLQAYDFLHLFDVHGCSLQIGASDQWGNITMGVELIRRVRSAEAYALTSPLVLRADGTKFGKSETGTVWLDPRRTSPYALYQFFVRTEDALVGQYLRYFTFLDHEAILELDAEVERAPQERRAQRVLARRVCALVHGEEEAGRAERAAEALYSEDIAGLDEKTLLEVFADAPATTLPREALEDGLELGELLVSTGLRASKSAARQLISEGGAYVNNRRVQDPAARIGHGELIGDRYVVLRRGRRDYHLLRFG